MPGRQIGRWAARIDASASGSPIVGSSIEASSTGTPAWWASSWRTVTRSLPAAPNSGQWAATGSSQSIHRRAWAIASVTAAMPLVVENTVTNVPSCHACCDRPSR